MKVLLIPKDEQGIIDYRYVEHYLYKDITNIQQVLSNFFITGQSQYNFKYCTFKDDEFMPFIFRIKDTLINQIQEFDYERVTYRELNIAEEKKEELITQLVKQSNLTKERELKDRGLLLLLESYVDKSKEDDILDVVSELENLHTDKIDYKKYLDNIV